MKFHTFRMRFLWCCIIIALLLGFGFACDSPRNVCHTRLKYNEADACNRALFGHILQVQRGIDNPGFAETTLYLCFLAEERRKKCDERSNIPWIGI
ncbi:MAG TPA: hypothetical protein DEA96_04835 [Leptospiraceae bacterium]|nr:hypothetical protein [Spirochaetaceae bacterium]HBS04269.1 hypothetical protein [Leptospiraceae bacterium]